MVQADKHLYRSKTNRMLAGVCGGIAEFFGIDATLVRLAFMAGLIFGFGTIPFLYLVMVLVVPLEPGDGSAAG